MLMINLLFVAMISYNCWKSGINKPKKTEDINAHHDSVSIRLTVHGKSVFTLKNKWVLFILLTKLVDDYNHMICHTKSPKLL